MLLEVENLVTGYDGSPVFDGVTLTFDGGTAGLVGPNGAGKTTLLRTLLGFLPFRSGRVSVCGLELPKHALAIRSKIGYMPEGESVVADMTAVEFVSYLAELSGLPHQAAIERAHAVLQYVGLGEARYRALETYSSGMKQRVKLAQAIAHDPQLLLLDEPTDGMDPTGRREMLELLNDLGKNKGVNIVVCSHLLDEVEFIANEIILINQGQIISRRLKSEEAGANRLFRVRIQGSTDRFVQALLRQGVELLGPVEGGEIRIVLSHDQPTQKVFAAAQEAHCVILRLEPVVEKAKDIVMNLMGEMAHANL